MSTSEPGPFETMQDLQAGPAKRSGLFRPSELGKDGIQHPVFVFGCGGGTTPSTYAELLSEVASHGFVVIAEAIEIGDMGAPLRAAIPLRSNCRVRCRATISISAFPG